MKKLNLTALCLVLFAINAYSQCKTKTDAISNEKVVSYEDDFREHTLINTIKMQATKTEIKLDFSITYKGAFEGTVPKGTEVIVKLANNEILKLQTAMDSKPRPIADYSGVFTTVFYFFVLTKEDVNRIGSAGCVLIRFPDFKSGNLDLEKAGNQLGKAAKCISESPEFH